MKKLISSIIFALLVSFPALSEISVGLSANYSGFYGEGTETETNNDGGITKTQSAGAFEDNYPTVFAEYDAGSIIVGLSYAHEGIETPTNTNVQSSLNGDKTSKTNTVKAEFTNILTAYAIVPTPLFGLYVKGGYIQADIASLEVLGTGGSYPNADTTGIVAGFGIEKGFGNMFVRAEVLGAMYDDIEVENANKQKLTASTETTAKKVKVEEMMSANATISVGYSF